ncbi:phosphoglycerate kinase [Mycoplasmoides alvi]|uniref:phosphoglycerate kinase n=1 Tax=Mycoplasmoides alvi TaxID=78580 RepID=UPI0038CBF97C
MYNKRTLNQVDLDNKTVIVRLDLNVPMDGQEITDVSRITTSLPTLKYLIEKNCKIICLSHLGRIKSLDDKLSNKKSLLPVAKKLQEYLDNVATVKFLNQNIGDIVVSAVQNLKHKEILLLENTRYNDVNDNGELVKLESKNNPELGKFWASLADVFVNDAFGTAHRAHASNVGIASNIATNCIGFLVQSELEASQKIINVPNRPFVVILGGAKVSDKLAVIKALLDKADKILIGGGMANTFFKAKGLDVGSSSYEEDLLPIANEILSSQYANKIVLPLDQLGAQVFENVDPIWRESMEKPWVNSSCMSLDVGPKTIELFSNYLKDAKTIFWNGPLGVFEFDKFANGTNAIAKIVADLTSKGTYSVIGGGDSAAAINKLGLSNNVSFISTGGGASLTLLEGSPLPGIDCIQDQ